MQEQTLVGKTSKNFWMSERRWKHYNWSNSTAQKARKTQGLKGALQRMSWGTEKGSNLLYPMSGGSSHIPALCSRQGSVGSQWLMQANKIDQGLRTAGIISKVEQ